MNQPYSFHLYIKGGEDYQIRCYADSLINAESTFIARLDSGDYNDLIKGREYLCGEVKSVNQQLEGGNHQ